MPRTLKRRSHAISRDDPPSGSDSPEPVARRHQQQQRQRSPSSASSASSPANSDEETVTRSQAITTQKTLVKKLVRLALATEYSRQPLRRSDISSKIFKDTNSSRQFKTIFAEAQQTLQHVFGMQLVELPSREKTTLKDRRIQATQTQGKSGGAGGGGGGNSSTNKSWILTSTLPKEYKTDPGIVQPTHAPSVEQEAAYTALYTFILSLIYLNNNDLPEPKLERYLKRVNADSYILDFGNLDKVLAKMARDGYLERRRETSSGEEIVSWVAGPRGKVEVGIKGVVGLVKTVYGFEGAGVQEGGVSPNEKDEEELERRLSRSLGITVGSNRLRQADEADGEVDELAMDEGNENAGGVAATVVNNDRGRNNATPRSRQQQQTARQPPRRSGRERQNRDEDDDDDDADD